MSRIIVKGLPKYLTEDRLRNHFEKRLNQIHPSADGLLTDIKIIKDRHGDSRGFAFLGYRSESDAFDAVNYFDGSYIDTSKIEASMAKSFADPRVPVPMREKRREALKRLREKEEELLSQGNKKRNIKPEATRRNINADIAKNKQLQEFIETMKPSSKVASWETVGKSSGQAKENEDSTSNPLLKLLSGAVEGEEEGGDTFKIPENHSDDEYTDLNKHKSTEGEENMMSLEDFDAQKKPKTDEESTLAQDETVSDLDWLKNRRIRIREGEDQEAKPSALKEDVPIEQKQDTVVIQESEVSHEEENLAKIKKTGRLFLRNILYSATEDDFRKLFEPYGELEEVHIALDTRTGKCKGFAYVLFKNPDHAANAYVELDKQIFQGRLLHILPADEKKSHRLDEFDLKNLPLKKQRELKRKASATRQIFTWNSLFMNQNAVLSSVAAKLGIEKSQLIDPENSSSAVKQALAEAHVIGDVRKYFESRGVDLAKFGDFKKASERDDSILLLKNFPFGTTREELAELCLSFGKLQRILMPPSGTIAIVQFRDVTSARAAFAKLSFKRFKEGILYVEKGPKGCFTREAQGDELAADDSQSEAEVKELRTTVDDIKSSKEQSEVVDEDSTVVDGPTVSIFVKNLNFSTTSAQLSDKFSPFSGFVVAQVKTKPDHKHPGKTLSMGFGFVEYRTKEQALAVISAMDGTVMDGHRIQLKLSQKKSGNTSEKTPKKNTGKIIVKNLSFEATRKDVFELFSSFGQLKSVRVPKKFDKSARGFAFIEFLLPKEAENAMDQLQGVHLLGRRLVMQYAEQESDDVDEQIEKMTNKMKKQRATAELGAMINAGKRKLNLEENDENDGLNGF
ncbi:HDL028Wp [Eremothecium sinecaudum]|uniref:Multiple RNA-binding domain-containing protein 1 n=1 Tax=Eremothecium sinecaudum TaxID=45286 RepID=A0A109UX35_9SACH|nr:HDL028Wp [Eremothecium sinecaudum]AMD20716.1 HDL028Wp [Eremothecium sinecaudum]